LKAPGLDGRSEQGMAKKNERRRLWRWQRDAAAVVAFTLFPMLVMAGLFAPAVVHVEEDLVDPEPTRPRVVTVADREAPGRLLIPRDFSAGFMPELMRMENVFDAGPRPRPSRGARALANLLRAFSRHQSDTIVLDDAHKPVPAFLFQDSLGMTSRTPLMLTALGAFDDPMSIDNGVGYVPFMNQTYTKRRRGRRRRGDLPVIPEPGTMVLVGLGLGMLAAGRRLPKEA
jgi:hypothetical protein